MRSEATQAAGRPFATSAQGIAVPVRDQQLLPSANFALQDVYSQAHLSAALVHSPLKAHVGIFASAVKVINEAGLVAAFLGITD